MRVFCQTVHSCAWRGLVALNRIAAGFAQVLEPRTPRHREVRAVELQQQFGDNLAAGKAADVGGQYSPGAEWQRETLPAAILILIRADHTAIKERRMRRMQADRVALHGNLGADLVTTGTPAEVDAAVRRLSTRIEGDCVA
jgi:hypothetical protein